MANSTLISVGTGSSIFCYYCTYKSWSICGETLNNLGETYEPSVVHSEAAYYKYSIYISADDTYPFHSDKYYRSISQSGDGFSISIYRHRSVCSFRKEDKCSLGCCISKLVTTFSLPASIMSVVLCVFGPYMCIEEYYKFQNINPTLLVR